MTIRSGTNMTGKFAKQEAGGCGDKKGKMQHLGSPSG
jgi:hypothetical protein